MHPVTVLTVFAVVFPAELPDKTLIASLVLGSRFPPVWVWIGVIIAFTVHVGIAVTAGNLFALLPHRAVQGIVAALFAAGAVFLLLSSEEHEREAGEAIAGTARPAPPRPRRVVATSFIVLFAAEWGDITQIVTANLAAKYRDPLSVGLGAILALWLVAALAVAGGRTLLRYVPLLLVRRITAVIFAVLAAVTAIEALV
jgi:Ca2+/H+ antiporter, TMEM165/GDT1 family